MCDAFDVSRSGYRHFSSEKMTYSKAKRIRLVAEMKSIHNDPKLKAYGSPRMTSALKAHNFNQSMSGKGNCYDNVTYESFFSTLKREMLPDCGYFETREEAKSHIFKHMEGFYNTRRKHSSLGYQSPLEFIKENNQLELTA